MQAVSSSYSQHEPGDGESAQHAVYLTLADFVGRMMAGPATRAIDSVSASALSLQQLTLMLAMARERESTPINKLADELGLSIAATGRNVEKLVQLGYADRREDERDRRIKRVTLTDLGKKSLAEHFEDKKRDLETFCERLPDELAWRLHAVLFDILTSGHLPDNDPLLEILKVNI